MVNSGPVVVQGQAPTVLYWQNEVQAISSAGTVNVFIDDEFEP